MRNRVLREWWILSALPYYALSVLYEYELLELPRWLLPGGRLLSVHCLQLVSLREDMPLECHRDLRGRLLRREWRTVPGMPT